MRYVIYLRKNGVNKADNKRSECKRSSGVTSILIKYTSMERYAMESSGVSNEPRHEVEGLSSYVER